MGSKNAQPFFPMLSWLFGQFAGVLQIKMMEIGKGKAACRLLMQALHIKEVEGRRAHATECLAES